MLHILCMKMDTMLLIGWKVDNVLILKVRFFMYIFYIWSRVTFINFSFSLEANIRTTFISSYILLDKSFSHLAVLRLGDYFTKI